MSKLTFAIDFDGCLTEYSFPEIGEQTKEQKELLDVLIKLKEDGHKLILWTSRGKLSPGEDLTILLNSSNLVISVWPTSLDKIDEEKKRIINNNLIISVTLF